MKRLKSVIWNKIILLTLLILSSQNVCFGQNREEKENTIIDSLKLLDTYKLTIIEFRLKPLMYEANLQDSIKLVELQNKLTDQEIKRRILLGLDNLFTDNEIDDLYDFVKTSAYRKLSQSSMGDEEIKGQFKDIDAELNKIDENQKKERDNYENINRKFKPIPIDREDGFYETIDYDKNKKNEEIELDTKPAITKENISGIKIVSNGDGNNYIDISFDKQGTKKFYILTKHNIGNPIAIVIDKKIVSLPIVMSEITSGKANITGHFTVEEIEKIAQRLKNK